MATVVGVCIWLGMRASGPVKPILNGKPLGYWLKLDLRVGGTFADFRTAAREAYSALDTNAIPYLAARINRDAFWDLRKTEFNALMEKWHGPAKCRLSISQDFNASVSLIGLLGRSATPALLRVFEETSNTNELNVAAMALFHANGVWSAGLRSDPGWTQFVRAQETNLSPTAWKRFTNASAYAVIPVK